MNNIYLHGKRTYKLHSVCILTYNLWGQVHSIHMLWNLSVRVAQVCMTQCGGVMSKFYSPYRDSRRSLGIIVQMFPTSYLCIFDHLATWDILWLPTFKQSMWSLAFWKAATEAHYYFLMTLACELGVSIETNIAVIYNYYNAFNSYGEPLMT